MTDLLKDTTQEQLAGRDAQGKRERESGNEAPSPRRAPRSPSVLMFSPTGSSQNLILLGFCEGFIMLA